MNLQKKKGNHHETDVEKNGLTLSMNTQVIATN